ncbi:thioredoxin reductase (NADPH) [Acetoanaerobium pronyense]|uniref:Thioredoxin reductase n=1 Tax=Acetoanaerobium pronyense TaxID=1482736 RepID=A0ABS4KGU0_9FIRM|nr:thioredoxin-disulfide reductase [Acetoanaerobium pronyense]MBP2026994.1 thioredoxin reductase (NADPH) [Acetoanaerobium pronyense]
MSKLYDLVIIGAGPAGLSAGLYGARAKMSTLIIEKDRTGGQIVTTEEVANYPGSIPDASGPSLVARMVEQVDEFGAEKVKDNILDVDFTGKIKVIKGEKAEYRAKSVIVATGASPRKLDVPGEKELTGKGVSYCATCDADFFTDMQVFVVGGGDSAVEEAIYLTKFAEKVTIVHRRDSLKAAKSIQEKAFANPKIDFMWDTKINEIKGEGIVESVVFENTVSGEITEYFADEEIGTFGIFVFTGYIPQTHVFQGKMDLNPAGYIKTCDLMKTEIEGVFAAGDVREKILRQVVTATADGAIAAVMAEKYVDEHVFEEA